MKKMYLLLLAFIVATSTFASHLGPKILFTAHLSGDQEVPAVTTDGNGIATLYLNETRDTLCVRLSWFGLSGDANGIHIHHGAMGMNGDVLVNLSGDIDKEQIYGMVTGNDLNPALIADMLSGNTYLNLHTASNPNGEIRGQVMAETDFGYYSFLTTSQETDGVMGSMATGLAVMKASRDKKWLWIEVIADSLSENPTGAHIHWAAEGMSGPVILSLTDLIDGNRIHGMKEVTPGLVDSLMSGMAYINLHTSMNPAGEIRGQIAKLPTLGFDAVLDKAQETSMVMGMNDPHGVAHFHLYQGLDSLHFLIQVSGMSGDITGAHLHDGAMGTSGNVLVSLTPFVTGNIITGVVSGAEINPDFISKMLSGEVYLNVHTALNPNGEIRGQVYRYLREGYPIELDALQETAHVGSAARGIGFVSVDRDQSNMFVAVNVTGLSGKITGAHIHTGARGIDGAVTFNLSDWFMKTGMNDMAMGYEMISDPQQATDLRNGMMYLNIHTDMFANGEIRGQIERSSKCGMAPADPTGIAMPQPGEIRIYPNPTRNVLNIETSEAIQYRVVDVTGKEIAAGEMIQSGQVDLNACKVGVYFLQVISPKGVKTFKVQKQ